MEDKKDRKTENAENATTLENTSGCGEGAQGFEAVTGLPKPEKKAVFDKLYFATVERTLGDIQRGAWGSVERGFETMQMLTKVLGWALSEKKNSGGLDTQSTENDASGWEIVDGSGER